MVTSHSQILKGIGSDLGHREHNHSAHMKSIGFIKEHDKNHKESVLFVDIKKRSSKELSVSAEILNYLSNGTILIPMMHWCNDLERGAPIGPHVIRTDGEWIWPEYLAYYLRNGFEIDIPKDFLLHVAENSYAVPALSEEQLKDAAKYYLLITGQKLPRGIF